MSDIDTDLYPHLEQVAATVSTARAILEYVSEAFVTEPELIEAGETGSRAMLAVDAVIKMLRLVPSMLECRELLDRPG